MNSLRRKLVTAVFIISIICLTITSSISYRVASGHLSEKEKSNAVLLTQRSAGEIDEWLHGYAVFLETVSEVMELQQMTDFNMQSEYLKQLLEKQNAKNDTLYDIYFTSVQNVMAAGSGYVQDPSVDFTQRSWFLAAMETDDIHYESSYKDADTGRYVITLSKKVTINGEIAGVLAEDIFIDQVVEIVNQCEVIGNSYAMLIDQNQGLMVHPNEAYGYVDDEPVPLMNLEGQIYNELAESLQTGDSTDGIPVTDYDGVKRVIFTGSVSGCNWTAAVVLEQDVLNRDMREMLLGIGIAAIVSLLLGIVIIMPVVHGILSRLSGVLTASDAAVDNIESSSQQLAQVTDNIVGGMRQISLTMESINGTMDEQYSRVNNGRERLMELDRKISGFEEQFEEMKQAVSSVNAQLVENMQVVSSLGERTFASMEALDGLRRDVEALSTKSSEITDIVSTITSISKQTDILSLNASVEAAHAGEYGRGFAIVADEIRMLSEQTERATGDIGSLVTEIKTQIGITVEQMANFGKEFSANADIVEQVRKTFSDMEANICTMQKVHTDMAQRLLEFVYARDAMKSSFELIEQTTDSCVQDTRKALAAAKDQEQIGGHLEEWSDSLQGHASELNEKTNIFKSF